MTYQELLGKRTISSADKLYFSNLKKYLEVKFNLHDHDEIEMHTYKEIY